MMLLIQPDYPVYKHIQVWILSFQDLLVLDEYGALTI